MRNFVKNMLFLLKPIYYVLNLLIKLDKLTKNVIAKESSKFFIWIWTYLVLVTMTTLSNVTERQRHTSNSPVFNTKTNNVSTVLLHDIPIVSLYIEGQERLCLAQISNTLLKRFSYNEIHNRRVALGITCVQCTPVQLEILRRAGAMPVSSRRCGMITRREAERLCKSFLGDNAPPQLPDDFAFNVQHKCAWGCRGAFLPSRYNSSRAKCIKCSYCGLFFSPNKFIFHSHRISTGDKYVQPDAANFNSWRRHMVLSGKPLEDIVHAWEDVKAMFNGGTRKRLMSTVHTSHASNATASAIAQTQLDDTECNDDTLNVDFAKQNHHKNTRLSPKRAKNTDVGDGTADRLSAVTAAAVVGVTTVTAAVGAIAQQMPLRPFNMHHSGASMPVARAANVATEIAIMPFSRSFMMDYMWHAQTVQNAAHLQQHQQQQKCSIGAQTWIKGTRDNGGSALLFGTAASAVQLPPPTPLSEQQSAYAALQQCGTSASAAPKIFHEPNNALPQFPFNTSAFKPVIQQHQTLRRPPHSAQQPMSAVQAVATATASGSLVSTLAFSPAANAAAAASLPANSISSLCSSSASSSSSSSSGSSTSSLANVAMFPVAAGSNYVSQSNALQQLLPPPLKSGHVGFIKESLSSAEEDEDEQRIAEAEDDEMVDIESTEDDCQLHIRTHSPFFKRQAVCINKQDADCSFDHIDVDGDSDSDTHLVNIENKLTQTALQRAYVSDRNAILAAPCKIPPICRDFCPSSTIEIVESSDSRDVLEAPIKNEKSNGDKLTTTKDDKVEAELKDDQVAHLKVKISTELSGNKQKLSTTTQQQQLHVASTLNTLPIPTATIILPNHAKSLTSTGEVLFDALTTHCNKNELGIANNNNNNYINFFNSNHDFWRVTRLQTRPTHMEICKDMLPQQHQLQQHSMDLHHFYKQQFHASAVQQQSQQQHQQQQQYPQSQRIEHEQDLLLTKHFHCNNFRYLCSEGTATTQTNSVG